MRSTFLATAALASLTLAGCASVGQPGAVTARPSTALAEPSADVTLRLVSDITEIRRASGIWIDPQTVITHTGLLHEMPPVATVFIHRDSAPIGTAVTWAGGNPNDLDVLVMRAFSLDGQDITDAVDLPLCDQPLAAGESLRRIDGDGTLLTLGDKKPGADHMRELLLDGASLPPGAGLTPSDQSCLAAVAAEPTAAGQQYATLASGIALALKPIRP